MKSRALWRQKARRNQDCIDELRRQLRIVEQRHREVVAKLDEEIHKNRTLQDELDPAARVADWAEMSGHQYSAEMISLSCRLSQMIGFRAVPKVLDCVFGAVGLRIKVPSRDVVRNWSCRNGVAILEEACEADDWVWMIDHSVQLGKMFVLVVLGIRQSQLPTGRALTREDMTPLAVLPTKSRDKQEVARQLTEVAKDFGAPLAIVSDGASELHEGVANLENVGFLGVHLDDIKHKVSNLLKKTLGANERFKAFTAKLGQTINSIQQTEIDHLLPPRKKEKCRFMSIHVMIDWATMVGQQLMTARSAGSNARIRLNEKLGWIDEFREDLCCWREVRQLVGKALKYANEFGVFIGSSQVLRDQLVSLPIRSQLACRLREAVLACYQANEDKLSRLDRPNQRLPCSTEMLESAFGSFKALQGHHGRGTFTSLLAAFPTLFDTCTPEKIRKRFAAVSNKVVRAWIESAGLTNSTQARRTKAYAAAMAAQ
jgi:hypothetical protein